MQAGVVVVGAGCSTAEGVVLDLSPTGPVYSFATRSLVFPPRLLPVGVYSFGLRVSKGVVGQLVPDHYRADNTSVVVTIVLGAPPFILMGPVPLRPRDTVRNSGHAPLANIVPLGVC